MARSGIQPIQETRHEGIVCAVWAGAWICGGAGMTPALSAEEWAHVGSWRPDWSSFLIDRFSPPHQHKAAALALDGQPFGFTREDVGVIRWAARRLAEGWDDEVMLEQLGGIAERIEALLPPA